jgi:antitoxin HigA-1
MRERKRMPSHPGGILRRLYLDALGISNSQLAETLGVSRKTISKIVNERGSVTPNMALRLSRAFNTTPDVWLDLQKNYDLWQATYRSTDWRKVKAICSRETEVSPVS